jgi:signal transduction histidine kinase
VTDEPRTTILVVDDESSVLDTLSTILAEQGYEVRSASSAEEALALHRQQPFDLVLSDLRMQGLSGTSLIREIRRGWPDTLTVLLTGYASLDSAIEALREGAYDYLIKPCHVEELKATVARAVERGSLARALRGRVEELDAAHGRISAFAQELQDRVDQATAELAARVDELAEAKRQLEHAQQEREDFISMVVHELGQPLTTISAYAQLLERPGLPAQTQERARKSIASETRRLARLVQDLADATRIVGGRFQLRARHCDLVEIVREQVELARVGDGRRQIRLEAPEQPLAMVCDRDRAAQVLSNLLANAIKYAPGSEINVRVRAEGDYALMSVQDNGPGIPADRLEAIFEPYIRLERESGNGKRKGAGLGLYIARGIVEAHGGRIWCESEQGQGTTVYVRLPLVSPVSVASGEERERGR